MQITVTFRHIDPTPALRSYAEDKLQRLVKKYIRRPGDAHVILEVSKERHIAEITMQADHVTMFAKEETHDLYSAIDLALEKLDHQAQKLKDKLRDHKTGGGGRAVDREVTTRVLEARTGNGLPSVIRTDRIPAKPMTIEEAVGILSGSRDEFLVFVDADAETLAVLYRRRDGNFGLIEPEGR